MQCYEITEHFSTCPAQRKFLENMAKFLSQLSLQFPLREKKKKKHQTAEAKFQLKNFSNSNGNVIIYYKLI